MSARAPRRTFANPFVLTLAALPVAACTVQTAPPPQGPTTTTTSTAPTEPRDHRDDTTPTTVANPPRPETTTSTGSTTNGQSQTNANTSANTTTAQVGPGASGSGSSNDCKWTVRRNGATCESSVQLSCPKDVMCNPPPPQKYTCPPQLADGSSMNIIQRTGKGDCYVDFGEMKCPQGATCNPPRPEKVACPK